MRIKAAGSTRDRRLFLCAPRELHCHLTRKQIVDRSAHGNPKRKRGTTTLLPRLRVGLCSFSGCGHFLPFLKKPRPPIRAARFVQQSKLTSGLHKTHNVKKGTSHETHCIATFGIESRLCLHIARRGSRSRRSQRQGARRTPLAGAAAVDSLAAAPAWTRRSDSPRGMGGGRGQSAPPSRKPLRKRVLRSRRAPPSETAAGTRRTLSSAVLESGPRSIPRALPAGVRSAAAAAIRKTPSSAALGSGPRPIHAELPRPRPARDEAAKR